MKRMLTIAVFLALVAPTLALACHVTEVTADANCNGWNLCATVYFTDSVDTGNLCYQLLLFDDTGAEVNRVEVCQVVGHEPGNGGYYTYCFDGIWDGEYLSSGFHVQICASLNGGTAQSFDFDLNCTVDDETTSFSSVKAQYR